MRKNPKLLVVSLLVFALLFSIVPSIPASAASKRYFSDVKKSYEYREEIEWLANHSAYKGIAKKNGKFQPEKVLTRKELGKILTNLYGKRAKITIKNPSYKVTQKYMTSLLASVSKKLGYKVKFENNAPKTQITRAKAAYYIRTMMLNSSKLAIDKPTGSASMSKLESYIHDGVFDIEEYGWDIHASEYYTWSTDFLYAFNDGHWFVQMGVNPQYPGKSFITVGVWNTNVDKPDRWNHATYSYTFKTGATIATSANGEISIEALSHLTDLVEALKKNPNPNIPPNIKGATFSRCRFDNAFEKP